MVDFPKAPEELTHKLAEAYLARLPHRDVPQPRVFLVFSGMPGCGKSTLARKLAADLQALYVHHDTLRDMTRGLGIDPVGIPMAPVSKRIIDTVMRTGPNRFVILDASIDRDWQLFFGYAQELQATAIIIRLDVPPEVVRRRLQDRQRHDDAKLLARFDAYRAQFENCRAQVPADLTLGEQYNYAEVLAFVRERVQRAAAQQSA